MTVARCRPQSVLFACGQNSIRSPMAMALLRHLLWQDASMPARPA